MSLFRPFVCDDLFRFASVNLDPLTETYGVNFYLQYLANFPEYFHIAEHACGKIMGYIMGKAEGRDDQWHGHVTAVTVAHDFRRLRIAGELMKQLERMSDLKECYFVDLFVRVSNKVAVEMYTRLGYIIYRRVLDYYTGEAEEDAFDMRKALPRDQERKSMRPQRNPVRPEEIEY